MLTALSEYQQDNIADYRYVEFHILYSLTLEEIKQNLYKLLKYISGDKIMLEIVCNRNFIYERKESNDIINYDALKLQAELIELLTEKNVINSNFAF